MILPFMVARLSTKLQHVALEMTQIEKSVRGAKPPVKTRLLIAHILDLTNTPNFNHILHTFNEALRQSGMKSTDGFSLSFAKQAFYLQIPLAPTSLRAAEQFLVTLDQILASTALSQ